MRRAVAAAFAGAIVAATIGSCALSREDGAPPPLGQRAYVWQRAWTPTLLRELQLHASAFAALDVLAAEISFGGKTPATALPPVNWSALASYRIAVVIRAGPLPTRDSNATLATQWADNSPETLAVVGACRSALLHAEQGGVQAAELQLDFDAATAHLGEYRHLLHRLRREFPARRLSITALPAWLRSPQWRTLSTAVDAFVLQVHSLEKPRDASAPIVLFDAARTRAWIAEAAKDGRPFCVALPAYGYRVGFAADGAFLGLEAEGAPRAWPAGATLQKAMANPDAVAAFVRELAATRPRELEGICWFRFPLSTDTLAWRWPTLAAVMRGENPAPRVRLVPALSPDGTIDLAVTNDGTGNAGPLTLHVVWRDARFVACDAIGDAALRQTGDRSVLLSIGSASRPPDLAPGEVLRVGWLRLDRPAALEVVSP